MTMSLDGDALDLRESIESRPMDTQTRWLNDLEMRVWRGLLQAHAMLMSRLDRELVTEHSISLGEYEVLVFLSAAPEGRLRMSVLAQEVLISPSALTRRVDGLVERGLVARLRCPDDARGAYAVLTEAGRDRLVEAAPTHVRGVRSLCSPSCSGWTCSTSW